jgi:hypothetical protein
MRATWSLASRQPSGGLLAAEPGRGRDDWYIRAGTLALASSGSGLLVRAVGCPSTCVLASAMGTSSAQHCR